MSKIKLLNTPKIEFAHTFSADEYCNFIPKKENCIEISYISDGNSFVEVANENFQNDKYSVSVNFRTNGIKVSAPKYHEHHSVCFSANFKLDNIKQKNFCGYISLEFGGKEKLHTLIDEIIYVNTLYPERQLTVIGLFLQIIDEINALQNHNITKADFASLYAIKAKEYVYKNLNRPIQQKDVAFHLGITPEYLCYVFKKANGVSLMQFINTTKLTKIRQLMTKENLKLYEAASMYGFADANYASKLHKKYFGYNITESPNLEFENKKFVR